MHPDSLHRLSHPYAHVVQERWVALIACVRVSCDIRRPLVLGCISMSSADVLVLKRLELLLRTKFVGLGLWLVCILHVTFLATTHHD